MILAATILASTPDPVVQTVGALLILIAFAAVQAGKLDARSRASLILNMVGAGILSWEAARTEQWGFLLLEGTWTLVSIAGLITSWTRRPPRTGQR